MCDQAFWIVEIIRLTANHITIQYYGDKFLDVYSPLFINRARYTETFLRTELTVLHWNIKLTGKYKAGGGKISKQDLRVLSRDVRVAWELPEHSSEHVSKNKKKRSAEKVKEAGVSKKRKGRR